MEIMLGVISAIFFVLGIMMLKRKTIFIKGYLMTGVLGLCYLPMVLTNFITPMLRGYFNFTGLLFAGFYIFLIFILQKSYGDYILFNIEEDLLYEAIFTALEEEGMEYEDKRGKIILPSLDSEIKISIHAIFTTANIHLRFKKNKGVSEKIINRVKNILSNKTIKKVPLSGIVYIACSVFLMMFLIWM